MNGYLLIDKPKEWTSFDVVNKIRHIVQDSGLSNSNKKRFPVGHTGTLDPLATGLLVILLGNYTKRAPELTKLDKTYEVTMKLGETSSTGDSEGKILPYVPPQSTNKPSVLETEVLDALPRQELHSSGDVSSHTSSSGTRSFLALHSSTNGKIPMKADVLNALKSFEGEIEQTPPAFSAIKVNGKKAYELARKGKEVKLEPRKVKIYSLQLTDYSYPFVQFTAEVSSGTYIRSLVQDIGEKLDTGAYMSDLCRTEVGNFDIQDAISMDDITAEMVYNTLRTIDEI